jgi:photosynthetic reaction center cytochrome c subunit
MNLRTARLAISVVAGLALFGFAMLQTSIDVSAQQEDKPVEQVQKNIQVLKGLPSSQLLPVMHFMRTSLGVRCDYCHVAENGKYSLDDRPAKQTARRMLQMVFDINKANFNGQPVVTCNTCHRGSTKPIAVPEIGQGNFTNTIRAGNETKVTEQLPAAEQVFEKYAQALGGQAAIDRIKTRATKVTLLRPKLINSGTPNAAILNRAESWTIETFQKAPNKYLAEITTPDGTIYQGFNGAVGWTKTPRGQREMTAAELSRVKQQADLYTDLKLKDRYLKATVIAKEKLGEHEVYVIEAQSTENKVEKLYFDLKTGFLLRRTVFTEIKLGVDPEQTDFEDYRAVDGVWLPFVVRTSYLDDNHYGTTRTITEIKHNVVIDDGRFEAPK